MAVSNVRKAVTCIVATVGLTNQAWSQPETVIVNGSNPLVVNELLDANVTVETAGLLSGVGAITRMITNAGMVAPGAGGVGLVYLGEADTPLEQLVPESAAILSTASIRSSQMFHAESEKQSACMLGTGNAEGWTGWASAVGDFSVSVSQTDIEISGQSKEAEQKSIQASVYGSFFEENYRFTGALSAG